MEGAEVSGDGRRDGQWAIKLSERKEPVRMRSDPGSHR
jgi:hypothetical protein